MNKFLMKNNKSVCNDLFKILDTMGLPVCDIESTRHYWFIRTQAGSYFEEFFLDGFVGIGHEDVPCVAEQDRTEQLIEQVKQTHPQATRVLNQIYKFCNEIKRNDIVIIPSASSAKFAFGLIEDDQMYTEQISSSDIEEGKCPFSRRRKTKWITGIDKNRVDSKLYQFFRNQQALSQVDEYSEYIERALHSFYIKNNVAHFTLSVETPNSPNAFDIPIFMCEILKKLEIIYTELDIRLEYNDIKSRTNVQSPGLIEVFGDPFVIGVIAFITLHVFGGKISFAGFEYQTDGFGRILEIILEHLRDTKEIELKVEALQIKNPTTQTRAIGFIRTDNLIDNQSSCYDQPKCDDAADNPSSNQHT